LIKDEIAIQQDIHLILKSNQLKLLKTKPKIINREFSISFLSTEIGIKEEKEEKDEKSKNNINKV